jgi:hypothetical protein
VRLLHNTESMEKLIPEIERKLRRQAVLAASIRHKILF